MDDPEYIRESLRELYFALELKVSNLDVMGDVIAFGIIALVGWLVVQHQHFAKLKARVAELEKRRSKEEARREEEYAEYAANPYYSEMPFKQESLSKDEELKRKQKDPENLLVDV